MTTTTRQESHTDAMRRLAQVARESGVTLRRDTEGRYWASSISEPGHWHVVTGLTCTCRGYARAQRCRHLAALHAALGWIPAEEPEPEPAAQARCPQCDDRGSIEETRSRWVGSLSRGYRSTWTCTVPCQCQWPELAAVA